MFEIQKRHIRNIPSLSPGDMEKLSACRVLVAGCGGLGGNIIEHLTRMGVGALTVVDGDVFDETNLNRQILSTSDNLGQKKALAAAERVAAIDPSVKVDPVCEYISAENATSLMADADIVIDALDSAESRLILEDAAAETGLAIVHGAIRGWDFQAMLVPPGSGLLHQIYTEDYEPDSNSSVSVTPAVCAAIEAVAAVQYLCGHGTSLDGSILTASLQDMRFDLIRLTSRDE